MTLVATRAWIRAWPLLALWLGLRIVTVLWAALVSSVRPLTPLEQAHPLWPPSPPVDAWLARALLSPWDRWDVEYYVWIVSRGYRPDDGTAQFHPLLSWLATPLYRLAGNPLLALLLVSSVAALALLIVFERLARLDLEPADARVATLFLVAAPPAFILFAPYTEGLFLLWAALCLFWARRRAWWPAGIAAALAVLTRQQGLFLALPIAWELWVASGRTLTALLRAWRSWLALGCVPAGLLIWLGYRAIALGDVQPDWSHPQALIYSVLISPSAEEVVAEQAFIWPWEALWRAIALVAQTGDLSTIIDLVAGGGFLVALALAWPHMCGSYRLYTLAITLVSFAYATGTLHAYMGLPRHLLLALPVYIGLAAALRASRVRLALIGSGLAGGLLLLMMYGLKGWVP